jgi:hypothetical protein
MDAPPERLYQRLRTEFEAFDQKCDYAYRRVDCLIRELEKHALEQEVAWNLEKTTDSSKISSYLIDKQKSLQHMKGTLMEMIERLIPS